MEEVAKEKAGLEDKIKDLQGKIKDLQGKIKVLEVKIIEVEDKLEAEEDKEERSYLRAKELALDRQLAGLQEQLAELLKEKNRLAGGDSAMDALVMKVARALIGVKAVLKPVLKPVLQHAYRPRSNSSVESEYRPAALQHYTGELQPRYAMCAVSGVQLPLQDVTASHIYQRWWPPMQPNRPTYRYLLLIPCVCDASIRDLKVEMKDVKINDPCNILLMHCNIKKHFDSFVFTGSTPVISITAVCTKLSIADPHDKVESAFAVAPQKQLKL
ncbi:hypothetical protein VOLCADRAFT_100322 [Volvox carteri f. nagariensis]|uniref:HNH nuclease domain-containing protein n=1 Tax=Volvox carteri f. nagariensis TaxID=3068 RepID=D8UK00_VOLCA|nr:uncharacterized protein VOLCADRAFT_100322 [Volvox carteri f. nagariensis]EFJ39953.1 hypothetical protein VOLCADRAFT_100322 [Volvox carteri f. nagariensis]|eukprot:XP_002958978.1 hypothetical protein VOLCADRAFT_100322 [Volvox carteri f. nagariensis]